MYSKLKQSSWARLGTVLLLEWPLYAWRMAARDDQYLLLRNRYERLEPGPDANGFRCEWQWTSELHAPKVIAPLGRQLMRRALRAHPIRRAASPAEAPQRSTPAISFLIGYRGIQRLPHLLATLESIAAQENVSVECIVVEQDTDSTLRGQLPAWVRYFHTPPPAPDMPYCRSWSFNFAAQHARGAVLVLHDNDMLVSVDYASHILDRVRRGYDAINLARFVFYLTQSHTDNFLAEGGGLADFAPAAVVQNLEGGGSIAITRAAYDQIGGMDESFIGWGGEDNEFWERAQTLRLWSWGSLPLVHLHHPPQPGKEAAQTGAVGRYQCLSRITPTERIRRLEAVPRGLKSGPMGSAAEVAP